MVKKVLTYFLDGPLDPESPPIIIVFLFSMLIIACRERANGRSRRTTLRLKEWPSIPLLHQHGGEAGWLASRLAGRSLAGWDATPMGRSL